MKKNISIIFLVIVVIFSALTLGGCYNNSQDITLNTTLTINTSNAGSRKMDLYIPNTMVDTENKAQKLDELISKYCPHDITFNKAYMDENVVYSFVITFESYNDYLEKLRAILGFDPGVIISRPDTIFTSGTRVKENFSSKDLLAFFNNVEDEYPKNTKNKIQSTSNTININGNSYTTGEYISLNEVESVPVDYIDINTTNLKNGKYNRTIKFSFPKSTMNILGNDIYSYMNARTITASSSVWNEYPSGDEFIVTYNNLDIDQLQKATNELFGSYTCSSIDYLPSADETSVLNNESNFTEKLDISGFSGASNEAVNVNYSYNIEDDGISKMYSPKEYINGEWDIDDMCDGYSTSFRDKAYGMNIMIPDGYSLPIEQTNVTLEYIGNNTFNKTISFSYPADSYDAAVYTDEALKRLSPQSEVYIETYDDKVVASIGVKGDIDMINSIMCEVFGENNKITHTEEMTAPRISMHDNTILTDTIKLSDMYTEDTDDTPIYYSIKTTDDETLDYVTYYSEGKSENSVNIKRSNENDITFSLDSHDSIITFNSQQANFLAFLVAIISFIFVIFVVILILIKVKTGKLSEMPSPDFIKNTDKKLPTQKEIRDIISKI